MNKLLKQNSNLLSEATGPIPYSWKFEGKKSGPTITILGGIHGDETAGIEIVETLISFLSMTKVVRGKINLALGNVPAILEGKRKLDLDMNRLFGEDTLELQGPELERVRELEQLLQESDLLLDIHSTIDPSTPFVAVPSTEDLNEIEVPKTGVSVSKILDSIKVPIILQGQGLLHPDGKAIYTDSYTFEHGGIGLTIEAGWTQDPKVLEIQGGIIDLLANLGIIGISGHKNPISPKEIWNAKQNIVCENETFTFTQDWQTFDQIKAETIIATYIKDGKLIEVKADEDCMIIFPKKNPGTSTPDKELTPGFEACILAVKN
jgi:predicted deacylase